MGVIVARSGSVCGTNGSVSSINTVAGVASQVIIAPGTTGVLDSVSVMNWANSKWYVAAATDDRNSMAACEIFATHNRGTSPVFNLYAMQGDPLDYEVSCTISSGHLHLHIQNNTTKTIAVYGTRISVPFNPITMPKMSGVPITDNHVTALPNVPIVVDSFEYWKVHAVKWVVSVTDQFDMKLTSQIFAMMKTNLYSSDVEYGLLGDLSVLYTLYVQDNNNRVELVLVNHETSPLLVDLTRIPIITDLSSIKGPYESTVSLVTPPYTNILPGASGIVDDKLMIPGHVACKWLIYIEQPNNNISGSFELAANRQHLTNITHVPYGYIGNVFDIEISTTAVGTNMALTITNNELHPISVYLLHIPVTI